MRSLQDACGSESSATRARPDGGLLSFEPVHCTTLAARGDRRLQYCSILHTARAFGCRQAIGDPIPYPMGSVRKVTQNSGVRPTPWSNWGLLLGMSKKTFAITPKKACTTIRERTSAYAQRPIPTWCATASMPTLFGGAQASAKVRFWISWRFMGIVSMRSICASRTAAFGRSV